MSTDVADDDDEKVFDSASRSLIRCVYVYPNVYHIKIERSLSLILLLLLL